MKEHLKHFLEDGYKYVPITKDEYPIWSLWDGPEVVKIEGLLYKDLLEDNMYFDCTLYDYEEDFDRNKEVQAIEEHENSILEIFIHEDEDNLESTLKMAEELNNKIKKGYVPKVRDVLGKFVGADTPYEIVRIGKITRTFEAEDIVDYLNEELDI